MDMVINPDISLLDQVKMQAQVLVPVLKALRAELGEETRESSSHQRPARMVPRGVPSCRRADAR
jgi:hypothetical protein